MELNENATCMCQWKETRKHRQNISFFPKIFNVNLINDKYRLRSSLLNGITGTIGVNSTICQHITSSSPQILQRVYDALSGQTTESSAEPTMENLLISRCQYYESRGETSDLKGSAWTPHVLFAIALASEPSSYIFCSNARVFLFCILSEVLVNDWNFADRPRPLSGTTLACIIS